MEQIIRELLADCRAHLQDELENEVGNYTTAQGGAFDIQRRHVESEGLEYIVLLEALIRRIDIALAPVGGEGI